MSKAEPNRCFKAKLLSLLKYSVRFKFPETKNDYIPKFDKPVLIQKSLLKNLKYYLRARKNLKKLDLKGLEWTYNNLADEYSKEMMLKVVVYNLFSDVKIRFPLYYSRDFDAISEYEKMVVDDETISLWFDLIKLKKYDLRPLGYDITMWNSPLGSYIDFVREQYRYRHIVEAKEGDYVIDGGACYGDTALYFMDKTKGKGKAFSFEFMPENIDIFDKNMDLNPQYRDNIELIQQPLGISSGRKLYAVFNGPGTSITEEKKEGAQEFETISIDDFVERNNIEKIDFIKLDIEGSEEAVLRGAVKTIQKFKPQLAICAYHKKDDLWVLPQLIKEIVPEYNLYLDHHTINFTETVIYARV